MKIKKRKNQGQSTKSLQTFDNPTKRRKPFNSGEQLRTKSGGSVRFSEEDDVDLDDDLDDDSSTTRIRVQPLTDRRFEIMNAASALRKESVQSYEDDDDNDDNYDDDDPAANAAAQAAYKKGEDPQKILDNWQESKIKKSQQQKNPSLLPQILPNRIRVPSVPAESSPWAAVSRPGCPASRAIWWPK